MSFPNFSLKETAKVTAIFNFADTKLYRLLFSRQSVETFDTTHLLTRAVAQSYQLYKQSGGPIFKTS